MNPYEIYDSIIQFNTFIRCLLNKNFIIEEVYINNIYYSDKNKIYYFNKILKIEPKSPNEILLHNSKINPILLNIISLILFQTPIISNEKVAENLSKTKTNFINLGKIFYFICFGSYPEKDQLAQLNETTLMKISDFTLSSDLINLIINLIDGKINSWDNYFSQEIFKKIKELKKNKENLLNIIEDQSPLCREDSINLGNSQILFNQMSHFSSFLRNYIEEKMQIHPEKFVTIEDAINGKNIPNNDKRFFIMGALAKYFNSQEILTAIQRDDNFEFDFLTEEEKKIFDNLPNLMLQFIVNNLEFRNKYEFVFDIDDTRVDELLNDKNQLDEFDKKLIKKISEINGINEEDISITDHRKGTLHATVVISKENSELDSERTNDELRNDEDNELNKIKDINKKALLDCCVLSPKMFDTEGDRKSGWGINEKRGGRPYHPPLGWTGYGLKVTDNYDDKNNNWLSYAPGTPGQWCIAYHGACRNNPNALEIIGNIVRGGRIGEEINEDDRLRLKKGKYQACKNDDNISGGGKVGLGVYCTPKPEVAQGYSGEVELNGEKYFIAFMLRVKPEKIRISKRENDYWVLNGDLSEIRPYRILLKKVKEEKKIEKKKKKRNNCGIY